MIARSSITERLFPSSEGWTKRQRILWGGALAVNLFGLILGLINLALFILR